MNVLNGRAKKSRVNPTTALHSTTACLIPNRPRRDLFQLEKQMPTDGVNKGRRRFLIATTSVVGATGAGFAAVPFVESWLPSA
ncbi:MAG: ubiquinol-cytochrome c reductase iron-sulfur subunit N-terminal domain-containing protein, partial [Lysobacterales bacterium]